MAAWTAKHLVNRPDAYVRYLPLEQRQPGKTARTVKARLTNQDLVRHYRGDRQSDLVVLHSTYRDEAGDCWSRWLGIDIDRHSERVDPEGTLTAALAWHERALSLGFTPLLLDSNGDGGYHLIPLFDRPVPTEQVFRFANWLIQDWRSFGLESKPETFPKQATIKAGGYGNGLRLPGRHHTRDHWTKVYRDGEWLEGIEAIRAILQTTGQPPELIPAEALKAPERPRRPARRLHFSDSEETARLAQEALEHLNHLVDDYDGWLMIGMALTELGATGLALWEGWSQRGDKYNEGDCERKWASFTRDGGRTLGTLFHEAKQAGWEPPWTSRGFHDKALTWRMESRHRTPPKAPEIAPNGFSAPKATEAPALDTEAVASGPGELTDIAQAMADDLARRTPALHAAPTGSGKTYSIAQLAADRYKRGLRTLIAVPTLRLAGEITGPEMLRKFIPEAFEAGAVAEIFGRPNLAGFDETDPAADDDDDEAADEDGRYPIDEHTSIVLCTHAQLGRRGFSTFLRGIWRALEPDDHSDEPPFAIIIDEISELVRASRRDFPLAHRSVRRWDPDRSGGRIVPIRDCPKSNRSGNCGNCQLVKHGGEPRFNRFGIREAGYPKITDFDAQGAKLRKPRAPLIVRDEDLTIGPKVHVSGTVFAAPVLAWRGFPVDDAWERRNLTLELFRRDEDDSQPSEDPEAILGHMLRMAYRPVLSWEHPTNELGEIVPVETLATRIKMEDKNWADGTIFPRESCGVPRLRFTDLAVFEQVRRYAQGPSEGMARTGVILTGATLGPDEAEILRSVWPDLVEREHPYPDRRVRQIALVCPQELFGPGSLLASDLRLATAPLEEHGLGLVFTATKKIARSLYEAIAKAQPTARLAIENHLDMTIRKSLHEEGEIGTVVTYSRGVLGLGANVLGVRHLIADARAFRSIAGFTPGELTPEEFERMRAEERTALILQNLGRALRGEKGKTVALIILNADDHLLEALRSAESLREGGEEPLVIAQPEGDCLQAIVKQAGQWLAQDGGDWPEPAAPPVRKRGRKRKSAESLRETAEKAVQDGMSWRDFSRKYSVHKKIGPDEIQELRARFP